MGCEESVRLYKPSMLHETSDGSFSTFALVHFLGSIQWKAVDILYKNYHVEDRKSNKSLHLYWRFSGNKSQNKTQTATHLRQSETNKK